MKYPFKYLKIKTSGLLLLATMIFIVNSCKKDEKASESIIDSINVSELKKWYSSDTTSGKFNTLDVGTTVSRMIKNRNVTWDIVKASKRTNSKIIEFDLQKPTDRWTLGVEPSKTQNKNSLIVLDFEDGHKVSFYMKVYEDLGTDTVTKIKNVHYKSIPAGFNGQVLYFTLNQHFVNGYRYINGKIIGTYATSGAASNTGPKVLSNGAKKTLGMYAVCSEAYNLNYTPSHPEWGYSWVDSGYQECYYYNTTDNDIDSGPEGGGFGGDTGGGGSGGDAPNTTATIINDVTGCNGLVINKLLDKDLSGRISNILQNIFNSSDAVNLHFVESNNTNGAPTAAIVTNGAPSSIFNMEIRINTNILPAGASQDYKASLVIHEIIHAYLDYKHIDYDNQIKQHADLARDYISDISAMLHDVFGTSTEDANALAFGGLADFATRYPTEYAQLLANKNLDESTRSFDTEMQRVGLHGTSCP